MFFSLNTQKKPAFWILSLLSLLGLFEPVSPAAAKAFPLHTAIVENVRFWEAIYSQYDNNVLVIHDAEDLSKIYGVLSQDKKDPGARRKNRIREQQARKNVSLMLEKLSKTAPASRKEKKISAIFRGKNPQQQMKTAANQVRMQSGQQQRFRDGVIRSGAYLAQIKKIFKDKNLPEDLAYLPHVESSYHTGAHSKAGAAGIWQFTRTTGKRYLIIDDAVDERLDPITATQAAAKYLALSYQHLKNWPLAVTAYNYGLPGTIRAQKKHNSYSAIFRNHKTGTFKFASRNFYSEFLAARNIAKKLEKSLNLDKPEETLPMKLNGYAQLSDITSYFGVSTEKLKKLNPALKASVFKKERRITKGYTLRLPSSALIQHRIATFPKMFYYDAQTTARYHRVQKGETAASIARRFGISLKNLYKINKLNTKGTIYVNQMLCIPGPPENKSQKIRVTRKKRKNERIPLLRAHKKKSIK